MIASPEKLPNALDRALDGIGVMRKTFTPALEQRELGTIANVSTGIAKVHGLPGVGFEELIRFPGDLFGIAFNIDPEEIGAVLLGDCQHLHAGDEVQRTGRVMDVAAGEALIGRIINPLGKPLDGLGLLLSSHRLPIEREAKQIMDRAPVTVPLQTGVKASTPSSPLGEAKGN